MTLNLNIPSANPELTPRITVVGVGGAGGNAVNNMIQSKLSGVEFLITNTDAQAIQGSLCERNIQLGRNITQGLGAGSRPDIGRAAAEEALDEILGQLEGCHMVFVTAGMGGGTGTGAAPVIARAAREAGILTVGVVTKPFHFEGVHRMRLAESGINELTQYVDTLIIIPNQNLFRVANEKTTFADAFKMADDVLDSGVRGVTDLMVNPGLINLDFADIRSVMSEMGKAMMGTGDAEGENRALEAAEAAISNPLLDDVSMKGARGVLINITGGPDMTLFEVDEAANRIRDEVDPEANIIFGSTFNESLEGSMRVSVVATGIDAEAMASPRPVSLSVVSGTAVNRAAAEVPDPQAITARRAVGEASLFSSSGATAQAVDFAAPEAEPVFETGSVTLPEADLEITEPTAATDAWFTSEQPAQAEPEPQPQAEPAAAEETQQASFYAPPPVQPDAEPEIVDQTWQEADPFAAADLANASGSNESPRRGLGTNVGRKAESLFAKVTGGAARALQAAAQAGEGTVEPPREAAVEPRFQEREMPARTVAQMDPAPQPASQPRLSGLDARERIVGSEKEEDLLDIPAFLRRQAN